MNLDYFKLNLSELSDAGFVLLGKRKAGDCNE